MSCKDWAGFVVLVVLFLTFGLPLAVGVWTMALTELRDFWKDR